MTESTSVMPSVQPVRRGLLLVLSSPSGAGKTTLARRLLDSDPTIAASVSVTTRSRRPGEVEGRDYHFVDAPRFKAMRDGGELLEWAEVFGNFYGTPRKPVMDAVAAGRDVLFDIDWQGARQLATQTPADLVRVFILPPTAEALAARLKSRNQDPPEIVARRMAAAAGEITHWNEYDYVLINDDLVHSFRALESILAAERLKRARQIGMAGFVEDILQRL